MIFMAGPFDPVFIFCLYACHIDKMGKKEYISSTLRLLSKLIKQRRQKWKNQRQ